MQQEFIRQWETFEDNTSRMNCHSDGILIKRLILHHVGGTVYLLTCSVWMPIWTVLGNASSVLLKYFEKYTRTRETIAC